MRGLVCVRQRALQPNNSPGKGTSASLTASSSRLPRAGIFQNSPAQAVAHSSCDRKAALLSGNSRQAGAESACAREGRACDEVLYREVESGVIFEEHPAAAALARNSDESIAIRARRIDLVIDNRVRRVADSKAHPPEPLRHLGFFFMPSGARAETFVKRPGGFEHRSPKGHIRAEHAPHFLACFAFVENRQVQIDGIFADLRYGIFGRQDSSRHRGELGMFFEELLDRIEIPRSGG